MKSVMNLAEWERKFEARISQIASSEDPAHDLLHFKRVLKNAKKLCAIEGGQLEVVVPAAWLHDFVIVPKDSHKRSQASKLSAIAATEFLQSIHYPDPFLSSIAHAIEGHSFSANITVQTLEAKIVQDADRLDGLGAIGIARCFATAGLLKRDFYSDKDPFCSSRVPDDSQFTIDHFYKKLFKTAESLKTLSGQAEGKARVEAMKIYLRQLEIEVTS